MRTEITYRWRVKWNGKWGATRWDATEEQIRREHPEAVPIDGTRKERQVCETEEELAAYSIGGLGVLQRPPPDLPSDQR